MTNKKTPTKQTLNFIEQIKGPEKPESTAGLSEQLSPNAVAESLKQSLGFADRSVPSQSQVEALRQNDQNKTSLEIDQITKQLGAEQKQPLKPQANMTLLRPAAAPQETPAYVRGKPGYNPEAQPEKPKELPPLPKMSSKQKRGMLFTQRKQTTKVETRGGSGPTQ